MWKETNLLKQIQAKISTIWVFLKNQSFEITQIKLFYGVEVFAFCILLKIDSVVSQKY